MKPRAGLTLVELILAAVLAVVAAAAVISGYNFLFIHTKRGVGRGSLSLQIDYALEKIRLQCESASAVYPPFDYGVSASKPVFCITGEKDPYNIDISDSYSKKKYCYKLANGSLILERSNTSGIVEESEVLIDSLYEPSIRFEYIANTNPFSLTAAITATAKKIGAKEDVIRKRDNIRFRYTKIVK